VLTFAAVVSLITAIAFGLAPAFRTIAAGRMAALGMNQRQAVGRAAMRGMRPLLAGQIGLSVLMVYAAALYGRTLINFLRVDPGFSVDRLATASFSPTVSGYTPDQMPALGRRLVEAARTLPGVVSAAVSTCGLVAGCSSSSGFDVEGAGDGITLNVNWVSPGYFPTVGIPLIRGRDFGERDTSGHPRVAIVNESIARRYFGGRDPIGRRLGFAELDTEIVGVVSDAHTQTLHAPPIPMVYFPVDQKGADIHTTLTNLDVRVAGDPGAAASGIRDAIRRAEPDLLLGDVGPMSQRLARDLSRERLVAWLAVSFGALTLLLAALGLYGVLSYGVSQRTQEIGVRMALGARPIQVVRAVLGQSVALTIAGIAGGLLASAAGARSLSGMLFGVTPLDVPTLIGVPLVFVAVLTLASYLPARRATKVDPLVALRCE
jgi:predicted permease